MLDQAEVGLSDGEERRAQILEAAFGEFVARGYSGATIKDIARAAGLRSPALIYWYFPDKESLFGEVLEAHAPVLGAVPELEGMTEAPPEEVLPALGRAYLLFNRENTQGLRLIIGEAVHRPEVAEVFFRRGPERVLEFLEGYLERQVELGRLRPHDTASSARAYIGALIPQIAGKTLFPSLGRGGPADEDHLQSCTELFLRGLARED